jgi:hypothetical protein
MAAAGRGALISGLGTRQQSENTRLIHRAESLMQRQCQTVMHSEVLVRGAFCTFWRDALNG